MLAICVPLGLLIAAENWSWSQWVHQSAQTLSQTSEATKLLFFLAYMSICCTFLPLPTGWMVAALASHQAAIAQGLSSNELVVALATTFIVGAVGGLGSSMANLNDYHLFTWLLRSRRVAKVRNTRTYRAAARWFARSPFFLVVLFAFVPIPVDVIRMLAATYRYPRTAFAAANFIGRFVRYSVIAFVTYYWHLDWIAVAVLFGLAIALGAGKAISAAVRRIHRRPA